MPLNDNVPLNDLPNLGNTTVMWLRAIGIRDSDTLRDRGIYWAYERMQGRGFRVTTAVLFSLAGALQDRPWRSFNEAEKNQLLETLAAYGKGAETGTATETAPAARGERALPKAAPRHPVAGRAGPARAARKQDRKQQDRHATGKQTPA